MSEFSFASINAANLGEWSDESRIDAFVTSMVTDLGAPLIIAIQEIGAAAMGDAPVKALVADTIIQKLAAHQWTYHYADIAPMPETTGGAENMNIRCGFLYRAPVELRSLQQIGADSPFFIGSDELDCVASRLPLVGEFVYQNDVIYIINCHLKSMSLKNQTKKQAKKQRNQQSKVVAEFIEAHNLKAHPLIIAGDMNDTFNSKTVQAIAKIGFESVHAQLKYQIYTYKYQKKPILLDYILYNEHFTDVEGAIAHINTDPMNERRYSDHDPILMTGQLCSK